MKRGKPTRRGMSSPSEPPGSDPPPRGGLSRQTHRGLGDSQPPKLVTMHGVAPPSDSDPPPRSSEPPEPVRKTLDLSLEALALHHDPLPTFEDHELPSHLVEPSERPSEPGPNSERAQFRTAPGGGKNRVSGGRAAAAAYVCPSTLSPGHGSDVKLGPVEVDEHVLREARSFQTEPSLARRRASQVPPSGPITTIPKKRTPSGPMTLGIALLAVVGSLATYRVMSDEGEARKDEGASTAPIVHSSTQSSAPKSASAREMLVPSPSAAPSPSDAQPESSPETSAERSHAENGRNDSEPRPIREHAQPSSESETPHEASSAPSPRPNIPEQVPRAKKKRELWLE